MPRSKDRMERIAAYIGKRIEADYETMKGDELSMLANSFASLLVTGFNLDMAERQRDANDPAVRKIIPFPGPMEPQ